MKVMIVLLLGLLCLPAIAANVNDFNKALIDDVKKDIETDNDADLKVQESPKREPASVDTVDVEIEQPEPKVDKLRQLGTPKW